MNYSMSTEGCVDDDDDLNYCNEEWDPVCGVDKVTYPSCCVARVMGVYYVTPGTVCPSDLEEAVPLSEEFSKDAKFEWLLDYDGLPSVSQDLVLKRRLQQLQGDLNFIPEQEFDTYTSTNGAISIFNGKLLKRGAAFGQELIEDDDSDGDVDEILVGAEDTRTRIANTTISPFNLVGQLDVGCSGALIGTRYVLTAAHCILTRYGGQLTDLSFAPAKNDDIEPYGSFDWFTAYIPEEWQQTRNASADFAVIVYKDRISDIVGSYLQFKPNCAKQIYILNILGYPSDVRPRDTLYVTSCQAVSLQCGEDVVIHTCDTFGGMSGGPMIAYKRNESPPYSIKSIHTGGNSHLQLNFGTNMNPRIVAKIEEFINDSEQKYAPILDAVFSTKK